MYFSNSADSKKNMSYIIMDDKKVYSIQKGQRIHDKYRRAVVNLVRGFGNDAVVSSCLEYDINKKRKI
jgi:hypothetical protein